MTKKIHINPELEKALDRRDAMFNDVARKPDDDDESPEMEYEQKGPSRGAENLTELLERLERECEHYEPDPEHVDGWDYNM